MKTICILIAFCLIMGVAAPTVHAQSSADLAAPASFFTVVPTPSGHPKPFQNDLHSVSASSKSDIWAVGQTAIHFDGSQWTAFSVPGIKGDNTSRLGGVMDFAPNNVWTVGIVGIGLGATNQVIEHFDGTKWSLSPGPKFQPSDQPSLESVTALSPNDMWAAGFILTDNAQSLFPLFEHYDGTSWTAFETAFGNGTIFGVSADATNDVWAVGSVAESSTFIEHYDGSTWSVVPSPNAGSGWNILFGVAALAPNDVWAAGYFTEQPNSTRPTKTLIEHWDGTSWKIVPSPNVGPKSVYQSNQLWGITASAGNVWAFGSFFAADGSGQQSTLVLHWNGTAWVLVPSPDPRNSSFRSDILFGGTVIPTGDLWIVGNEFGRTLAINATGH
ncbi:MAG: hypothetical protein JWQ87_1593 [Candidatus Sulfotelmatobacter sp.]|nr:hypothetical protein [Candidatus Sulfotelmatobacter sp.]